MEKAIAKMSDFKMSQAVDISRWNAGENRSIGGSRDKDFGNEGKCWFAYPDTEIIAFYGGSESHPSPQPPLASPTIDETGGDG